MWGKLAVKFAGSGFISGGSILDIGEATKINVLSFYSDTSPPPALMSLNSAIARFTETLISVPDLLKLRSKSQIRPSVIGAIAVFMINGSRRIFACHHFPDDTISEVGGSIESADSMLLSVAENAASRFTCVNRIEPDPACFGRKV